MANALYFRHKAEQCHRLADGILSRDDPASASLHALGVEFDARAAALEAAITAVAHDRLWR